MPLKQPVAAECQGQWITTLFRTSCERPGSCLYGYACLCCAVYHQRVQLLEITGEPYICVGGLCPVGPLRNPQGRSCLAIESCLCPCWALNGNRYIVQTRFDKANTFCDNLLLAFTFPCSCWASVSRLRKETPEIGDCTCIANFSVAGCMHAQQQIEIDEIKQNGYYGPRDVLFDVLPPMQQEMIQLGKPMGTGRESSTAEAIGSDGVVPSSDLSKKSVAPAQPAKKYDVRSPLCSLCKFWP